MTLGSWPEAFRDVGSSRGQSKSLLGTSKYWVRSFTKEFDLVAYKFLNFLLYTNYLASKDVSIS